MTTTGTRLGITYGWGRGDGGWGDAMNTNLLNIEEAGYFSVKAAGAIGDGITNDRAAIQSAIDACEAAGGGTVFFPPGTYIAAASSSNITMKDGVSLLGCGRKSVLKDTNSLSILNMTGVDDFSIQLLSFTSTLAGSFVAGRGAIWADASSAATRGLIQGCFINGVNTGGISMNATDVRIIGNDVRTTEEHGIYLSGAADCSIVGNVLSANGSIGSGAQAGVKLASAATRIAVVGNTITGAEHEGILFDAAVDCSAVGNTIRNSGQSSIRFDNTPAGCSAIANTCVNSNVLGNVTIASIDVYTGDRSLISNNRLSLGSSPGWLIRVRAGVTDTQVLHNQAIATNGLIDLGTRTIAIGNRTQVTDGAYDLNTFLAMIEQASAPAAPSTNGVRVYSVDNGGKTELLARFATGASVRLAIEP